MLRVGTALRRVQVLSRVNWWRFHFDTDLNLKVRCQDENCNYCLAGIGPQLNWVLGVHCGVHGRMLLELRESFRPLIAQLHEHETGGVGTWLQLWRDSEARNSKVRAEFVRWEPADEWDIEPLVSRFGTSTISKKSEKEKVSTSARDLVV